MQQHAAPRRPIGLGAATKLHTTQRRHDNRTKGIEMQANVLKTPAPVPNRRHKQAGERNPDVEKGTAPSSSKVEKKKQARRQEPDPTNAALPLQSNTKDSRHRRCRNASQRQPPPPRPAVSAKTLKHTHKTPAHIFPPRARTAKPASRRRTQTLTAKQPPCRRAHKGRPMCGGLPTWQGDAHRCMHPHADRQETTEERER